MKKEIVTQRLCLRPLGPAYLHSAHAYASDLENTKYMLYLPNHTLEETKAFLSWAAKEWEKESPASYEFAIVLGEEHIGAISLTPDESGKEGELGWILHKDFAGKGYALEAALAVKQFAVGLSMERLVAHCDSRNVNSEKLMRRIGMQMEYSTGTRTYPDSRGTAGEYKYVLELSRSNE